MILFEKPFIIGIIGTTRYRYANPSALVPCGVHTVMPDKRLSFNKWIKHLKSIGCKKPFSGTFNELRTDNPSTLTSKGLL